jgi:hemoglobin/transferrin/lactoferrin receptor protein
MRGYSRSVRNLILGVSAGALAAGGAGVLRAQTAQTLDAITVVATKMEETAIDSLSAVSTRRQEDFDQLMPTRTEEIFFGVPGVTFQNRGDDPSTAINLRGLQDFGRVAVVVDGARQNFQKSGHNANGAFYLEPELLSGVDVVRGPVANIYGSGAIGGVVSFQTKDINDVLRPNERWGVLTHTEIGSNIARGMGSMFFGYRPNEKIDIFGGASYRANTNYFAGSNGNGQIPGIAANVGPGAEVPNSGFDVATGIAKATFRPAEGHEIKIGGLTYNADYVTGQPPSSTYDTNVQNNLVNARYKYARPDDNVFNWDANVYWTQTRQEQIKLSGATSTSTGRIGDPRTFDLQTYGTDIHNTSRFVVGGTRHAFTVGVDGFHDEVKVFDPGGANDNFTPSGERNVYGTFAQLKSNYSTWLEVIGALRYDAYNLKGSSGFGSEGDRVSPKITIGITPFPGITPYVTYAEGYRAPSLTETINNGFHPPFASFPGAPPGFTFLPNPDLRPEVGKTKEAGINLKFNDIWFKGDKFRAKVNVFRNDVDDFIDAVAFGPINFWGQPAFFQYQNIAHAQIEGVEFESLYDTGPWYVGLSGHHIRGKNVATGGVLATVPPDQIAMLFGVRFWDNKMTASIRWAAVDEMRIVPTGLIPVPSYNLVNFYVGYQPTPDVLAGISIENLLNEYYVRYREVLPSQGITAKLSLKVRFAGA